MTSSNPWSLTISKAHRLLASKQLSAVELTESVIERIKDTDSKINSFITITEESALESAASADSIISKGEGSLLTGIPFQAKDNICTTGITTTCASKMLENFRPNYDATAITKLKSAGAVLLGKGNLDEFAMGSSTENSVFFPTKNPHDLNTVPGGSSGGPAASVSAEQCLFSIGSDTGGSVRQPASFCGVVGLKPTYGRVSRYGLVAFASSLDQIGPLTKNVEDSAFVLEAISGNDPKDSTSNTEDVPSYGKDLNGDIKGLKVGVPKEYFVDELDSEVARTVRSSIKILEELGAEISEVSLPHTSHALAVYYIIAPAEASSNLSRYDGVKFGYSHSDSTDIWDALEKTRQYGFGAEVKRRILLGTYALSSGYYDAYYLKAQKVRSLIRQDFINVFKDVDILIAPSTPTVAFPLGEKISDPVQMYLNDIFTIPANIAGIPAISIPAGLIKNMPIGVQFMGSHHSEKMLLQAAYAYEKSADHGFLKPDI
jgi:aspartyl-tRNA(Asn)/glutamyl-tRNA(Gln) amidotransferase subunit A